METYEWGSKALHCQGRGFRSMTMHSAPFSKYLQVTNNNILSSSAAEFFRLPSQTKSNPSAPSTASASMETYEWEDQKQCTAKGRSLRSMTMHSTFRWLTVTSLVHLLQHPSGGWSQVPFWRSRVCLNWWMGGGTLRRCCSTAFCLWRRTYLGHRIKRLKSRFGWMSPPETILILNKMASRTTS